MPSSVFGVSDDGGGPFGTGQPLRADAGALRPRAGASSTARTAAASLRMRFTRSDRAVFRTTRQNLRHSAQTRS